MTCITIVNNAPLICFAGRLNAIFRWLDKHLRSAGSCIAHVLTVESTLSYSFFTFIVLLSTKTALPSPCTMLALLPLMAGVSLSEWNHGWGSTAEMTFADFNSNQVLTDQQLNFVNEKYVYSGVHIMWCIYLLAVSNKGEKCACKEGRVCHWAIA